MNKFLSKQLGLQSDSDVHNLLTSPCRHWVEVVPHANHQQLTPIVFTKRKKKTQQSSNWREKDRQSSSERNAGRRGNLCNGCGSGLECGFEHYDQSIIVQRDEHFCFCCVFKPFRILFSASSNHNSSQVCNLLLQIKTKPLLGTCLSVFKQIQ